MERLDSLHLLYPLKQKLPFPAAVSVSDPRAPVHAAQKLEKDNAELVNSNAKHVLDLRRLQDMFQAADDAAIILRRTCQRLVGQVFDHP